MRVPPGLGGPTPAVQLAYSAQAVDGQTAASNAQPSWIGEGFAWQPGSIERGYRPCADDGQTGSGDLCWAGDNATLSLNGQSSVLVSDAASGLWRPMQDNGAKVERLANPALNNGDADGEYWKVTSTDGTQYFFGLNRLPGWRAGTPDPETNSVFHEPVFGNNADEPCHQSSFAASSCQQAYRWNLDYVVDPNGNTMSLFYTRETNRYARNHVDTDTPLYVRAGFLREVDYGTRQDAGVDSVFAATAPARVLFDVADRCITPGATCTPSNPPNWPDVPWDQNCSGTNCAGRYAPTFWTTKKLSAVTTQTASGVKTWRDVERWSMTHEFKDPGDGQAKILWLSRIDHCGLVGATTCLSPVLLNPTQMSNRVDLAGTTNSVIRYRLRSITSEAGGVVSVTYSAPECVAGSTMPAAPDSNTKRCFPISWVPPGSTTPKLEYFHKYVATAVAEADLTGGGPDEVTTYTYTGTPAWHYDDNPLAVASRRTWSQWRGYQQVRTVHGAAGTTRSQSDATYFRGMNGDRTATGTRTVTVSDSDGGTWVDADWFAGMLREQITYLGTTNTVVAKTKNDPYQFGPTASQSLNGTTLSAYVASTAVTTDRTALDGGRGWRTTTTTNTFLADRSGRLARVDNAGDVSTTADDQCTRYTYATNSAGTMLTYVARVDTVGVNCATTPDRAVDTLSDVRTWYDGASSFGTTVSKGNATRVEQLADWNSGAPVYRQTSRASHDAYGRVLDSFDPLDHKTSTAYTPASGGAATRTVVTDPVGWTKTTDLEPAWGAPVSVLDVNDRRTDLTYDGLGQLTAVWLPGRSKATQSADLTYGYTVRNTGGPNAVATSRLNPTGTGYLTGFTLYDGRLRPRQTQAPAVGGGRVVSETLYDSRGLVAKSRDPYFNSAAPGTALFVPTGDNAVPGQTVTMYDGAERATVAAFQVNAVEKWRTSTAYGGDHTTVTAPPGGTATTTWTDARDRTTAVWQYHSNVPTGAHDDSARTYTRAGDLATVVDPAGNTWRYGYDQRRRATRDDDPDKGRTTFTYDDAGQLLTATDARGVTLAYTYDALGRKTAEYLDSPSGTKLAEWTYDTLAKGQLTSSTRWENGNPYTTGVTGYTARYQPTGTRVSIPAAEGVLAGEYTTAATYHPNGSVATARMPAKTGAPGFGGIADETLTYGYTGQAMPATLSGLSSYVTDTQYLQTGQLSSVNLTDGGGRNVVQYWGYENGTTRMVEHQVLGDFAAVVAEDTFYAYDPAGNVTSIADKLAQYSAGADDTQCFGHDYLGHLAEAWTPASGDCATAPTTAGLGGPAPYWSSFSYDVAGNRTGETRHAGGGDTVRTFAYPAPGPAAVRPHAVTAVTSTGPGGTRTDAYDYDPAGNTTSRPGTASAQAVAWNPEGHVAAVTDNGQSATYVYDASGNRLLQRDASGRTLYLDGAECRAPSGGGVTCTRFYAYGEAGLVAVRGPDGVSWQTSDHQGTTQLSFRATDLTMTRRRTTPFGTVRGTDPTWSHAHGFVGGVTDPGGRVHIGAREYDPSLGAFLSVDPVFDVGHGQGWNGYGYADNTPVTRSDPSGLRVCLEACGSDDDKKWEALKKSKPKPKVKRCRMSPEDCDSATRTDPKRVWDHKRYNNGTVLTVYTDGTVDINGYILPRDYPDPYLLAESVDRNAPQVRATQGNRSDFENAIRGVHVGCERMPSGCSANFLHRVVLDLDAAHRHTLLPSYIGSDHPYVGGPTQDVAGIRTLTEEHDDATGLERRDFERRLHEQGIDTLPDYTKPKGDPITGGCVNGIIDMAVVEGTIGMWELRKILTTAVRKVRLTPGGVLLSCAEGIVGAIRAY